MRPDDLRHEINSSPGQKIHDKLHERWGVGQRRLDSGTENRSLASDRAYSQNWGSGQCDGQAGREDARWQRMQWPWSHVYGAQSKGPRRTGRRRET
jgi:hypothetical protein